ncbi:putative GPI anchored cell wall protein [Aspergillus thermomutatus]|uniref:GPI anchored cell wall protein n=1 Tax=Aspergillus thermomutatus TaxID=41047 RepID=A0A397I1K2_ASPTH|nr:uncharacterized protein CDV56_100693 [Aspergillus thermomutatus]RHZ66710.1 hypothetical protein CDV56_100693 [Aspergillus thermomutatus]
MHSAFILLAGLAATVSAQTTEVQVFNAGPTTLPLHAVEASIVDANAVATTLAISPFTITQGPSTYTVSAVYSASAGGVEETYTVVQDCDITSSTQLAVCSMSARVEVSALGAKTFTTSSATLTFSSHDIWYTPIVVTAGVEKLTASKATQTPASDAGVNAAAVNAASGNMGLGQAAAAAVAAAALGLL